MALLPAHSQNYSRIRKKSLEHACNQVAVSQRPVSHRGQALTPSMLRQMGNCPPQVRTKAAPPHALEQAEPLRPCVLSWNAGHLGQQQWSEVKSWLTTEATQTCDILVLQETHWQATAEFNAAGWYCVSSASPDDAPPAGKGKNKRGGTAHLTTVEARPDDAGSVPAKSRPSVTTCTRQRA